MPPKEISQKRLIQIFKDVKRLKSVETRFCFLLGAGASRSSGIPTGWELATRWYKVLQEVLEPDELKAWEENIDFEEKRVGEFYTHLYQKRYESSPQMGYEEFKSLMEDKEPGIGYVILAQVLANERHNFVITTNFDYLVEDAVRMYTPTKPFSAGHETLAGFISSQTERPTIIKVHRDLFLNPFNEAGQTDILKEEWKKALRPILNQFHLLVIGYGGNDGSLMDYLAEIKAEDRNAIYWCKRKQDELSDKVNKLLEEKDFVATINDFDELMYGLYDAHEYDTFKHLDTPEEHPFVQAAKKRIINLRDKRNDILKKLKEKDEIKDILPNVRSLFKGGSSEYQYKAAVEEDIDEQEKIHLEGIEKYPNDASLLNNYGIYLYDNKRYEEAIEKYKKAIEIKPDYHEAFNNWGNALGNLAETKTGSESEKLYLEAFEKYKRAIEIKPDEHEAFYNWGNDLAHLAKTKSGTEAENLLKEALEKLKKGVDLGGKKYNLACAYALLPDKKNALLYLEQSLENKEETTDFVLEDKDWQAYLNNKDFQKIIKKYEPK